MFWLKDYLLNVKVFVLCDLSSLLTLGLQKEHNYKRIKVTFQGIFKTGVFEIQGLLFFSYSIIDCQNSFYPSLVDYYISYLINVMVMHKEKLKKGVLVQDILEWLRILE